MKTPETAKEALEMSIEHWKENVKLLEESRGEFCLNRLRHSWSIGGKEVFYDDDNCGLCVFHNGNCYSPCVLEKYIYECNARKSPWKKCNLSYTQEEALSASRNMLKVLEEVYEKEYGK